MVAAASPVDRVATGVPAPRTEFAPDDVLRHRDLFLNERVMATILGRALNLSPTVCRRRRTKYRVGESLRVVYELIEGAGTPTLVSLRLFPDQVLPADQRNPDIVLEQYGALGWIFPHDRKMPKLAEFLADGERQAEALGHPIDDVTVVGYAPEKVATIRCGYGGQVIAYAKLYANGADRAAAATHRLLEPHLDDIGIRAPRVVAADTELGLVALSNVDGVPIADRKDPVDWYNLGRAIAQLHHVADPGPLDRFDRATPQRLAAAARLIAMARPDCAAAAYRLLAELSAHQAVIADLDEVLLHGDVHGKNVLAGPSGPAIVDFDQAAVGPAAAELGSAVAALRYDDLTCGTRPLGPILKRHFLDGYEATTALPEPDVLAWFVAAALLGERALRAVNRVRLDGLRLLPDLLDSALDVLEDGSP